MIEDITQGWTGPLDFQLKADGVVPGVPLPGSLVLILKDKNGATIDTSGKAIVLDAQQWTVRFTPGSNDLIAANGPYTAKWKITDGGGKVTFFPSGEADAYRVFPQ